MKAIDSGAQRGAASGWLRALAAAALAVALGAADQPPKPPPRLIRVAISTLGAADPAAVAKAYQRWLGYVPRGEGRVSKALAGSWGAPGMAGRRYVLVSPAHAPDALIRVVAVTAAPGYRALTTAGWNSAELMVDDIEGLHRALRGSPFKAEAAPASGVPAYPTIKSMRVEGPAHETLFLTSETGDRARSILETPQDPVGRPFVAWVIGPDILRVRDWYARLFGMGILPPATKPVPGAPGQTMPNAVLLMAAKHNLVQFEGDPGLSATRPTAPGELPPGNAMTSFEVDSLDGLDVAFLAPPTALYGSRRAATVLDPAGNRVELIERPAP